MIEFGKLTEQLRKPSGIDTFRKATANVSAVDNRETEWRGTLEQLMALYGFKLIGQGKYGAVYSNPKYPYVLKFFMKDTAYLLWLDFAKRHQHNPLVPKIKGKVVKIGPYFMAARLEKLTEPTLRMKYWDNDPKDPNVAEVSDFLEKHKNLADMHMGNIMARGDQAVIIDPFYNWFKPGQGFTMDPEDISKFKAIL